MVRGEVHLLAKERRRGAVLESAFVLANGDELIRSGFANALAHGAHPIGDLQIEAQRKGVRALAYYARLTPYLIYENQIEKMGSPKLAILPSAQSLTEKGWQALLKYVDAGGNLLVTGPVDRDDHWQRINRAAELIPGAHAAPLTYHNATVVPEDQAPMPALMRLKSSPLSFDLQGQSWLETLHFGAQGFAELNHGKGRIFWSAEPVELAQGDQPAADIYTYVAARMGIKPEFDAGSRPSPGVLIYTMPLDDSVLYIIVSDSAEDSAMDVRDNATGVHLTLKLPAEHAALALIGKKEKAVIAKYGF